MAPRLGEGTRKEEGAEAAGLSPTYFLLLLCAEKPFPSGSTGGFPREMEVGWGGEEWKGGGTQLSENLSHDTRTIEQTRNAMMEEGKCFKKH